MDWTASRSDRRSDSSPRATRNRGGSTRRHRGYETCAAPGTAPGKWRRGPYLARPREAVATLEVCSTPCPALPCLPPTIPSAPAATEHLRAGRLKTVLEAYAPTVPVAVG